MFLRGQSAWIALALLTSSAVAPFSHASEVEEVCGDSSSQDSSQDPSQRRQHCQTAESAEGGATADKATAGVWAGVTAVCTYACAAAGTNEYVCSGSQMAGSVSEAAATRDFQSSLTSIASAGTTLAASQASSAANSAQQGAQQGTQNGAQQSQRNIGACTGAATAAAQTYAKVKSMKNAQSTAQSSIDAVRDLGSNAPGSGQGAHGSNGDAQSAGASAGGLVSSADEARRNAACAGVSGSSSHASIIQCALANDRKLPAFVTTPRFANELQKTTGMSLPEMVNRVDNPTPLLTQAMGGALGGNATSVAKIASSLKTLERGMAADQVGGSMYAGGGSGSGAASAGEDDSLAAVSQMMAGMMQQMNPDQQKEDPYKTGVGAVIFANQHRAPASVAEDRGLNLFDRVTYRYYYVGRRIVLGEELR